MFYTEMEKVAETHKKNVSELTNDNNLSYVNKFGETMTFKVDDKGTPFYNHTDIHKENEFYPTYTKMIVVLDEDEKAIFHLFETMALIQKRHKIV
jgi:hypothetical protein